MNGFMGSGAFDFYGGFLFRVSQVVRQCTVNASTGGSNPSLGASLFAKLGDSQAGKAGDFESPMRWFESSHPIQADVVQRQECNHAKVEAEGSSPSIRSKSLSAPG